MIPETLRLANYIQILTNHILRLHEVNEGYYKLPFGKNIDLGNNHPFILTICTSSERIKDIINNKGRKIKNEINKAMKKKYKEWRKDTNFNVSFKEWKIKKIETQTPLDTEKEQEYRYLYSLEEQTKSLGYQFDGYDIPWE